MVAPEPLKVNEQPNANDDRAKRDSMNTGDVQPESSAEWLKSSRRDV